MNIERARQLFHDPPIEARPAPFWFWNDRLRPERLVEQLDRLLDAGMGGVVMHARSGLDPDEYLDERWFAAVDAVLARAAQRGAFAWIYDELGWPSGTAGGRIPRAHPEFRMRHLRMEDIVVDGGAFEPDWADDDVVAAFHVTRTDPNRGRQRRHDGGLLLLADRIRCEPIELPVRFEEWPGERLLIFHTVCRQGAADYFNPAATAAFLTSTHQEYFRRYGPYFGATIRHAFMDEAGMFAGPAELPWAAGYEEEFQTRRGYALAPQLPALFFDTPGHETVRYDFWSLCAEKFRDGFAKPMDAWCREHGIAYSGHYVFEATLKEAVRQLGATMPLYEYQGLPGIDILGNDFYTRRFEQEAYAYYVVTIKQAASVVRQLGKPGLMSESYGVSGPAMGPEALQAATNFQFALGVTFICHHAAYYSIRGQRKRDCPGFFDWRQPYWRFFPKHLDAIARTGWLLSQGNPVCRTLLVHPASSMQAAYRQFRTHEEYKAENYLYDADLPFEVIDKHFTLMSSTLMDAHIDHDYGDEELLAKYGAVENARLRLGRGAYDVVVLPPMLNLRSSTLRLLQEFARCDGVILQAGAAPRLIDGRPAEEAAQFLRRSARPVMEGMEWFKYGRLVEELVALGARTVDVESDQPESLCNLKVQHRTWGESDIFFLANISRESIRAKVSLDVSTSGHIEEWDTSSGVARSLAPCTKGEPAALDLEWAPGQAHVLVTAPGETMAAVRDIPHVSRRLRPEWQGRRAQPNVLVLDVCRYRRRRTWSRKTAIWQAGEVLRKWIRKTGKPARFAAQYAFHVSETDPPAGPIELAVELGAGTEIRLNEESVPLHVTGDLLDPAIVRIPLPGVRPGANELDISAEYADAGDFCCPWILGDFRVATADNVTFVVEAPLEKVAIGAWPALGMPFYAGSVIYTAEIDLNEQDLREGVTLDMSGLKGAAEVKVNDQVVDQILWPPYQCDVTGAARAGVNRIEIETANTLRNLLGPHYEPREETMTGFSEESYRGLPCQPKRFLDYGLVRAPEILIGAPR